MAERSEYLVAVVGADVTQFRKSMRDIRNELGILAHEGEGLRNVFRSLGETMTYALSAPMAVLGAGAVQAASSFESAMRNINSVAFLSETQFAGLTDQVFEFGKVTREGSVGAAEALNTIYQAGLEGSMALSTMKTATYTAEAGLADMETTAEGLVATMLAFGFSTEAEAIRAGDALTRMVQVGVGSMQSFAGSIATFLPSAAALGVTMEESFGIDAMLTQFGFSASEAAVRTNAAMRSMIKPSEAMSAAISKLGAGSAKELIEMSGGLAEALFALRGTTNGTEEALAELFSDTRALQGVLLLTQNIDRTRDVLGDFVADIDGATNKARWQQAQTLAYAWDSMGASIQAAGIAIGEILIPVVKPLVAGVRDIFLGITELDKTTLGFAVTTGVLVAAVGPMVWLFSSLLSPTSLLIGSLVGLAHAIGNLPNVGAAATKMLNDIATALGPIYDKVTGLIEKLFSSDFSPTNPYAQVEEFTGGMTNAVTRWSHTVEQGDTLWDIWYNHFLNKMSFDDFLDKTGFGGGKTVINAGDLIEIKYPLTNSSMMGFSNSGGRDGIRAGWWQVLSDGISDIAGDLGDELNSVLPAVDKAIGGFFTSIGQIVGTQSMTGGNTPVYQFIRSLIDGFKGIGGSLSTALPEITAGISSFLTGVWDWLKNEAIPTGSRAIGFIAGTLARMAIRGFNAIFDFLNGGGVQQTSNEVAGFVQDSLVDPLLNGFGDGLGGITLSNGNMAEALSNTLGLEFKKLEPKATEFFNNFGTWLSDTGIPLLSKSIGYFAGALGSMFTGALRMAFGAATGDDITSGIADSVIKPMSEGFGQAMKDFGAATTGDKGAGQVNPFDYLLESLSGAIMVAAIAAPTALAAGASVFAGAVTGVMKMMFTPQIAALTAWLAPKLAAVGALAMKAIPWLFLLSTVNFDYLGKGLSGVGLGFADIMTGIFTGEGGEDGLDRFVGGLKDLTLAIGLFPAQMLADIVTGLLGLNAVGLNELSITNGIYELGWAVAEFGDSFRWIMTNLAADLDIFMNKMRIAFGVDVELSTQKLGDAYKDKATLIRIDQIENALNAQIFSGEAVNLTVPLGTIELEAGQVSASSTSIAALFDPNSSYYTGIVGNASVGFKRALENALMNAISDGDTETVANLLPIAGDLGIDVEAAFLRVETNTGQNLDNMRDKVMDILGLDGQVPAALYAFKSNTITGNSEMTESFRALSTSVPEHISLLEKRSATPLDKMIGNLETTINLLKELGLLVDKTGGYVAPNAPTEVTGAEMKNAPKAPIVPMDYKPADSGAKGNIYIGSFTVTKDADFKQWFKEAERRGYNPRKRL